MSGSMQIQTYEFLTRHASDVVHWVEGSGVVLDHSRPLHVAGGDTLNLQLVHLPENENSPADWTPKDLTVTHKPGMMILWRRYAQGDRVMVGAREVNENKEDYPLDRPTETAYRFRAKVVDYENRFNPREINLSDVGNYIDVSDESATGHEVKLYRSPKGTRMGSMGGLQGTIKWNSGEVASWAIITCEVKVMPGNDKRSFVAQADVNGDFRLAFSSIPFPKKQGNKRPPYECEIFVKALKSASGAAWPQPDEFSDVEIMELDKDDFESSIELDFDAGSIQRLISSDSDAYLIVK